MPEGIELIYKKSEIGFNGDGTYYEVYNTTKDLIYKIDDDWNNHKNIDIEKSLNEELNNYDVPNFSKEYIFKK